MQINLFGEQDSNLTDRYSHKCSAPQYEPSSIKPEISSLCSVEKYSKLVSEINKADIPDDIKQFLRLAATRHIVFNYAQIADYYANTTPEVQRLMENSALVIIDINDAIANGYVKLSKSLTDIMEADNEE